MAEGTPQKSGRFGRWVAGGLASMIGAVAIGASQGIGANFGDVLFDWTSARGAPASTAGEPTGPHGLPDGLVRSSSDKLGSLPSPGAGSAIAEAPAAPARSVVKATIPLSLNAVGHGATEALSCGAALRDIRGQADRQCRSILLEQRGSGFELRDGADSCRSCGPLGSEWRCVADSTTECIIKGEI